MHHLKVLDIVLKNIRNLTSIDHLNNNHDEFSKLVYYNTRFIMEYPELFTEATDKLVLPVVNSVAFKYSYSLEYAQDLKVTSNEKDIALFLENELFKNISKEIKIEQDKLKNNNLKMVTFLPLNVIRVTNSESFQPMIAFKTRYAASEI